MLPSGILAEECDIYCPPTVLRHEWFQICVEFSCYRKWFRICGEFVIVFVPRAHLRSFGLGTTQDRR